VDVAVGSDDDPPGREELAHFVEHMLFKDDGEKSEQEIEREVLDRGGSNNGLTYPDHSFYYVHIPARHGEFAVDWLWRRLRPRVMDPALVAAERDPILLEIGARPRELLDWFEALYWDPAWLRLPDYWKREFGLDTRSGRDDDLFRSVHAIQPEDLHACYQRWYVPERMVLMIAGDFERDALEGQLERSWGTLERRDEIFERKRVRDPGKPRAYYDWNSRSNVDFNLSWRLFDLNADEVLDGIFLGNFLSRRLTEQLRRGEDKSVYSISAGMTARGPATVFQISAAIHPRKLEHARGEIEKVVALLRGGELPPEEFARDREALVAALRSEATDVSAYMPWQQAWFHDTQRFAVFPDVLTAFEQQTPESVSRFIRTHWRPESRMTSIQRPHPFSRVQRWGIGIMLVWLVSRLMRLLLVRSIEMTRIRYVARLRLPLLYAAVVGAGLLLVVAVLTRLAWYLWSILRAEFVLPTDDLVTQEGFQAGALVLATVAVLGLASLLPRKLLLFDDVLLVKYLAWRSRPLHPEDLESVGLARFHEVWLSGRLRRCVPLTLGIFSPGILLETRHGRSYYFSVRDRAELLDLIEEFRNP
jgi:predicted Zn-dependent peptidase